MTETALAQLIKQAKAKGSKELDLRGQYLTSLPAALGGLLQLQVVRLGWNKRTSRRNYLTALPDWMANLTNLQSLDLSSNMLKVLPDWMANLTNLQSLDLSSNMRTALPDWMANLTSLQSLNLSSTDLRVLPDWMANLTNLQSLSLSFNKLTTLPDWMANLTNLQSLDLNSNNLTVLPDWMANLTNLQSLDVSSNNLTVLPDWMANLTNLQSLDVSSNNLTVLPDWMANLTNLQSLDLRLNRLAVLPDWTANLTNLQYLYLSTPTLTVLPDWMANLTNLQSLDVSATNLTALPDWMANLTNLQSLNLHLTKLKALPDWMANLINLQYLDLSATDLKVLPDWMANLTNLQYLYLSATKLKALPDWMANLTHLQSLKLSATNLKVLPDWMANLTNLQSLDLSANRLTALPDWMANLTNLQSLDLRFNKLAALPDWMANLTNLQSLNLRSNDLTALPDGMANLTNLQSLDLRSNDLTALPDGMANLTNLQSLDLSSNNLPVLPDWMANLTNLQSLNLGSTDLKVLPDWMANLTNLQSLDLSHNNLMALPDWMADPKNLPQLSTLFIAANPLLVPPPESIGGVSSTTLGPAQIDAIRRYFRQLQESDAVYFYEAKLLIIGEGGAGKTSLARKLKKPDCQLLSDEKSTEGIDVLIWQFPIPDASIKGNPDDSYTVKIWDFGGQEIYFATHQFFLTKRSVYLLVADTRRQHTDFYTWLLMQETFGEDSPVLLIKNRNRRHGNNFTIENMPQLRERFPNLQEPIEIDLNEIPTGHGWKKLLQCIQEHLLNLPHIAQPRPSTWIAVRTAVRDDHRSIITRSEFVAICQSKGMNRAKDIQQLCEYMHNLGDILYFHEDPILREYVILKPTWGLDAVYKVLDNRKIEECLGMFSHSDLRLLWNSLDYRDYHSQLLRLMENFQICYPLPNRSNTYIAPQLLSEEVPAHEWDESENLQLRYEYPVFMPRGILSRAIVKLHQYIEDQRLVWRSGVILFDQYARAELLELRSEKQIRIRVSGSNKRDLLMHIVRALDELHHGFPKLQFKRLVPCNCAECLTRIEPHFFGLEDLRNRLANRTDTIECQKPPYHRVPIPGLLSDIRLLDQRNVERGGVILNIDRVYFGDHSDYSRIASDGDSLVSSTVHLSKDHVGLTDVENRELKRLVQQKAEIEGPLRKRTLYIKRIYIILYLACIPFLWFFLTWLIAKKGWNDFEPISYTASIVFTFAGPLLVKLSPETFSPSAIEKKLFERWRARSFAKYAFDSERYQHLMNHQS